MSPLDHVWQILGIKRVTFRLICNCACKRMSIQDSFYPSKTWISPLQWDELISEGAFLDFFLNQCFHENFGPVHFFNAIRIKTSLKCIIFPQKSRILQKVFDPIVTFLDKVRPPAQQKCFNFVDWIAAVWPH